MRQRLTYLIKIYLLTILTFLIAKVVFMWCCHGEQTPLTFSNMIDVLRHGLSLDLSTGLYLLIVPFLVSMVSIWWDHRLLRILLKVYYGIVAFLLMLAFVADTSLYPFWGFKLNAVCLQYLETPTELRASVSGGYMAVRILLIIGGAIALYFLYSRVAFWHRKPSHRRTATLGDLLLIPLLVIGIRGGIDESTTNIGQVYFSQDQFLNHAAINPVFSFVYSLSHQTGDLSKYQVFSEEECDALLEGVFSTESVQTDTLLNTLRPNILVILMESAGEEFAQAMPRLQQLKREGISFSNCYGNSWRTDRGTVCALSGYPSFPTLSVMKMPEKSRTLPGIARTLRGEGYQTRYLYGGDINFTNMRSYLIATGWQRLMSMDDYSLAEQHSAQWGVKDEITFETLYQWIAGKEASKAPWLIGYSTLSSHEPWDVPVKKLDDEVMNAFTYLDDCLADFIERLKQTPEWDNLLIVVLPDHGINYKDINEQQPLRRNHIPMLWLGGAVKAPRTIDVLCSQTDLAATLLGQLRLPHEDFRFSRDVLSATYTHPTAFHNYSNAQMLVDSTGVIVYDFDAGSLTIDKSTDSERLQRINQAILQATTEDLGELKN